MMIEAILLVCLQLITAPEQCAFMNTLHRFTQTERTCEMWLRQGADRIKTREHYVEIMRALGNPKEGELLIKGKCAKEVINEPFVCKDCQV